MNLLRLALDNKYSCIRKMNLALSGKSKVVSHDPKYNYQIICIPRYYDVVIIGDEKSSPTISMVATT